MSAADRPHGLLTLVCITCGHEKHFSETPPAGLQCERCKGRVFRNYFTPVDADEATIAQLDATARSLAFDDDSPSVSADEVRDLDSHTERESDAPPP
jgi:hypothetical protein